MKRCFTSLTALLCSAAILLCCLPMQALAAEFRAFRPAKNAGGQMDSRKAALSGVRPGGVPPARKALPFD